MRRAPRFRVVRPWLLLALGVGLCALLLFPIGWMVLTALRPDADVFAYPPQLAARHLDLHRALAVFGGTPILLWLRNSLIVSLSATAIGVALGLPAGYALSRFRGRAVRRSAYLILSTQMMPPMLLLVPLFILFERLGLLNHLAGLVVGDSAWVLPLAVWMLKAVFDSLSPELDDAALVDGCSRLTALVRIIVPIALPGIAAVATYAFIETWDEFVFARTFIADQGLWTASVGLYSFQGQYVTPPQEIMATAALFTIPPVLLFLFAQRAFVSGLAAGGVQN